MSNRTVCDQSADYPNGWFTDYTTPLQDSGGNYTLNWYTSTVANDDPAAADYLQNGPVMSTSVPDDVKNTVVGILNVQSSPSITVFIHGLGTLFSDAIGGTAALGIGLKNHGSYGGLVIGFDWPSYGEWGSSIDYSTTPYSFPPGTTSGTIRGNINGSVVAFGLLVDFLSDLRTSVPGLTVSLVCHSEGNYMAMVGLNGSTARAFDHIVLLAADINNGALLSPANPSQDVGQGQGLYQSAADVTVYWTGSDEILNASADLFSEYHNPDYPDRLGYSGPSGSQSDQNGNVYAVDCSNVLDESNVETWVHDGIIPARDSVWPEIHISYLYVPEVLSDMSQVITGVSQSGIGDRTQVSGSNQWFTMDAPVFAEGGTGTPSPASPQG